MNLLLDTHILLWWLDNSPRLSTNARALISDPRNQVIVSAVSAWEIAIKVGRGKLAVRSDVASWLPAQLAANRFDALPVTMLHALSVEHLPLHHADPFDRLLIAQAMLEGLQIVTADLQLERYGVQTVQ